MKKRIIPIFVPHRGCPHDCIFCNQKKITGVSTDITSEDVKNIVEEYLTTIDKDASVEIAFFGGSFTAIDVEIQKSLLSVAKEYVDKGLVNDIRMSTRPDCIDKDILSMLKEYKVSIIELGVQSLDEDVLRDSIRGHHAEEVFTSWGKETIHRYEKEEIADILKSLENEEKYGTILRAKGMVAGEDDTWIYFDMVPGEYDIRIGAAEYTGRICVIGSKLQEENLDILFDKKN